jgi:uncharacterized protein YwgA
LIRRGLVDLNIEGDSDENFNNRLKLQKYVFLAKYYGLDMGYNYNYNMYLRGPYSRGLAQDYYTLAKNPEMLTQTTDINISNRFFESGANRDIDWLEVASTLLSLNRTFKDRQLLLERTINMKEHISREIIEAVLGDLESFKLISFESNTPR